MNSQRPNEQMHLPGIGIPVDPRTGFQLSPVVMARIARLKEAEDALRNLLHELDGTTPGSRPGDRRMAMAFTKLDEAAMWASAAILDHHGG